MVIECATPDACAAIAQQMREWVTIGIWITMVVTIGIAGIHSAWVYWRGGDESE